jgi:hypothetical protein
MEIMEDVIGDEQQRRLNHSGSTHTGYLQIAHTDSYKWFVNYMHV